MNAFRLPLYVSLVLLFSSTASADVYIKSKVMNGMGESEMWTSGAKRRTTAQMPMAGEIITITRADKGVEWQIRPQIKSYSEKPIALPYKKDGQSQAAEDQAADQQLEAMMAKGRQAEPPENDCRSVKVAQEKVFAGIKAEGYQAVCKDPQQASGTIWVAKAGESKAEKIQKEMDRFDEANLKAMYAQYPPKERERTIKMMTEFGTAMAQGMMGLPNLKNMPKRMALGMAQEVQGQSNMMMEVEQAEIVANDDSRYEIPPGFTKVEDADQAQARNMLEGMSGGNLKMSDVLNNVQDMTEKSVMPQEEVKEQNSRPHLNSDANTGLPPQKDIGNSFGAYDSPAGGSQQAYAAPAVPAQPRYATPPQSVQTSYPQAPNGQPQASAYPNQNPNGNLQNTLAAGQQLVSQIRDIASSFQSGGSGFEGGEGMPDLNQFQNYANGGNQNDDSGDYDPNQNTAGEDGEVVEETVTKRVIRRRPQY